MSRFDAKKYKINNSVKKCKKKNHYIELFEIEGRMKARRSLELGFVSLKVVLHGAVLFVMLKLHVPYPLGLLLASVDTEAALELGLNPALPEDVALQRTHVQIGFAALGALVQFIGGGGQAFSPCAWLRVHAIAI